MRMGSPATRVAVSFEQLTLRWGTVSAGRCFCHALLQSGKSQQEAGSGRPCPQQCPGKVHIVKLEGIGRVWVAWSPCCKSNSASCSEVRAGAFSWVYFIGFGQNQGHFVLLPYQLEEGGGAREAFSIFQECCEQLRSH